MYNKYLPLFIEVANAGSFSKAAAKLFLSPTAIIKQINRLEEELKIKLFERSHTGLKLTKEGEFLYEKAQVLIEFSHTSVRQAKELYERRTHEIVIGCSHLRHFQPLIEQIKELKFLHPEFEMKIINFSDARDDFELVLEQLGKKIDCFFGIFPSDRFKGRASVHFIRSYPLCLAVSINNPLCTRKSLKIEDLKGHKILIVERGDTAYIDAFRQWIEEKHPDIEIMNVPAYDLDTFNLCASIGGIMVSVELWEPIHPLLVHVPLDTPFSVPYGLVYATHPDEKMQRFVADFQDITA